MSALPGDGEGPVRELLPAFGDELSDPGTEVGDLGKLQIAPAHLDVAVQLQVASGAQTQPAGQQAADLPQRQASQQLGRRWAEPVRTQQLGIQQTSRGFPARSTPPGGTAPSRSPR